MTIKYTPLNSSLSEIRLLQILPGKPGDALACSVAIVSLDDQPEYEALSYVCGDASVTVEITVNGDLHPVTRSLDSALRSMRKPLNTRTVWADALCINQADVLEKNNQIPLMGRIYTQASEVIAFLRIGGSPELELFAKWAEVHLSRRPKYLSARWALAHGLCWITPDRYMKHQLFNFQLLKAEYTFWWSEYFQRMWTVQELALAKKPPIFLIGQKSFRLTTSKKLGRHSTPQKYQQILSGKGIYKFFSARLRDVLKEDLDKFETTWDPAANSARLVGARFGFQKPRADVPVLLQATRHRKCFDPRDRIFALYSLAPELEAAHPADYRKSPEQVLMDTICYVLEHHPYYFEFLLLVWPLRSSRLDNHDEYPSWLPDLTRYQPVGFHPWGYARAMEQDGTPPSINGTLMSLNARLLGKCRVLFRFDADMTRSWVTIFEAMLSVTTDLAASKEMVRGHGKEPMEAPEIQALLNEACFCCDFAPPAFTPDELYRELAEESSTDDIQHQDVWAALDELPLLREKANDLQNKAIFLSSSGLFGICSEQCQDGDELMVSPWLPIPALLRSRDKFCDANGQNFGKIVDYAFMAGFDKDNPQDKISRLVESEELIRIQLG